MSQSELISTTKASELASVANEVLAWAKKFAQENSTQALADLTGTYNRSTMSLYLNSKYPAGVAAIEDVLRPLMSQRLCPYLTVEITAKDCANRASRPRPHSAGSAMDDHWLTCQACIYKTVKAGEA